MTERPSRADRANAQALEDQAFHVALEAFCKTLEADPATLVFSTGVAAPRTVVQTSAGPCAAVCECQRCWQRAPAVLTRDDLGVTCVGFETGAACPSCTASGTSIFHRYPLFPKAVLALSIRQTAVRYPLFHSHKGTEARLAGLVSLAGKLLARDQYKSLGEAPVAADPEVSPGSVSPGSILPGLVDCYRSNGMRAGPEAEISLIGTRPHLRHLVDSDRAIYGYAPLFTEVEITTARGVLPANGYLSAAARDAASAALENHARRERFQFEHPNYAAFLESYQGDDVFIRRLRSLFVTTARFSTPELHALDRAMVTMKQGQRLTLVKSNAGPPPKPAETLRLTVDVVSCLSFERPHYHDPEVKEDVHRIEMCDDQGRKFIAKASRLPLTPGSRVRLMMTLLSREGTGSEVVCQVNRLFLLDADDKVIRARKPRADATGGAADAVPPGQGAPQAGQSTTKPVRKGKLR